MGLNSPGGSREPFGQPGRSRDPLRQPGRLQRPFWTARRARGTAREAPETYLDSPGGSESPWNSPGGSREPFGQGSREAVEQPGRLGRLQRAIWTAREALETLLGSPGGSRDPFGQPGEPVEQPGRLQRAIWTAREAPGRQLNSPGGSRRLYKETCATRFLRSIRRLGVMHSKGKLPLARALSCPRG